MNAVAVALLVTTGGLSLLVPVLHRARVMDVPNGRSSHARPIPRGGGIAVVLGILAALGSEALQGTPVPWPLVVAGSALAALGLADDIHTLSSRLRLIIQGLAAVSVGSWAAAAFDGSSIPTIAFTCVATVGLVGYVNAFNFMDGINGISAMNAAVAGGWYAWLGDHYALPALTSLGLAVLGSSLGFLPWNTPDARIFLGDVGSYAIGLLLGGMAVVAWSAGVPGLLCVAPLTLYLADTAWALVKRAAGHRPLAQAHREHVYQRLVDGGWTHVRSAALTAVVAIALCIVAATADGRVVILVTFAPAVLLAYLCLPAVVSARWSPRRARV